MSNAQETQQPAQTTALMVANTGTAIMALVHSVQKIAANMLPGRVKRNGKQQRGRTRWRTVSLQKRIEAIKRQTLADPDQPGVALVMQIQFEPDVRYKGARVVHMRDNLGGFCYDGTTPVIQQERDVRCGIIGQVLLPGATEFTRVEIGRVTTGDGNLVPAILPNHDGTYRAGPALACILYWEVDEKTLEKKERGRLIAMPLGLAPEAQIDRFNTIVKLKIEHKQAGRWFQIPRIPNQIGGREILHYTPMGPAQLRGLILIFNNKTDPRLNGKEVLSHESGDYQVVGIFGGKIAMLDRRSIAMIFRPDSAGRLITAPHIFLVEERARVIILRVLGLKGEVTGGQGRMQHGSRQIIADPMDLAGLTLKDSIGPRGVKRYIRGIDVIPVDGMIRRELITEATQAQGTWLGMQDMLAVAIKEVLKHALGTIVTELGTGRRDITDLPSLEDICGGQITPESIRAVYDFNWGNEENSFATWMLTQETVARLGFTEFVMSSWVLSTAFRKLFKQYVEASGHQIPPDAPAQEPPSKEEPKAAKPSRRRRPRRERERPKRQPRTSTAQDTPPEK